MAYLPCLHPWRLKQTDTRVKSGGCSMEHPFVQSRQMYEEGRADGRKGLELSVPGARLAARLGVRPGARLSLLPASGFTTEKALLPMYSACRNWTSCFDALPILKKSQIDNPTA